jgi:thiol:disulfide interchange protein
LGLASTYLTIAFSPGLRRFLPKPGIWMLRLKQFLAFPIYSTAVWLSFVLAQEAGEFAATAELAGLVLIAFAAWLYEAVRLSEPRGRRWGGPMRPFLYRRPRAPLPDGCRTPVTHRGNP